METSMYMFSRDAAYIYFVNVFSPQLIASTDAEPMTPKASMQELLGARREVLRSGIGFLVTCFYS